MKKRYLKLMMKYLAVFIAFCIIIAVVQKTMKPFYPGDVSSCVDGFYQLEQDSVDLLFLGSSQDFCTVDAKTLTEQYGMNSVDFAGSSQNLTMTKYYLQEALKVQKPKLVAVEIALFYQTNEQHYSNAFGNYDAMPLSWNKLKNIYEVTGSNYDVLQYGLFPLLSWHSRWSNPDMDAVKYNWGLSSYDYSGRGFLERVHASKQKIAYLSDEDGDAMEIPQETISAVNDIAEICEQNGIDLLFFKAPSADWTRTESADVKAFMEDNHYNFLEMNDYIDTIGLNPVNDFYNLCHLNVYGAEKATAFLAEYLAENYDL